MAGETGIEPATNGFGVPKNAFCIVVRRSGMLGITRFFPPEICSLWVVLGIVLMSLSPNYPQCQTNAPHIRCSNRGILRHYLPAGAGGSLLLFPRQGLILAYFGSFVQA